MGFLKDLATKIFPQRKPLMNPTWESPTPTPDPWTKIGYTRSGGGYYKKPSKPNEGYTYVNKDKIPQETLSVLEPKKTPAPLNTGRQSFGVGKEIAYIKPVLYDALIKHIPDDNARMDLAELSGQESSYGYAGPHISPKEQSYGPYHINVMAGRINPETGKPFTQKDAEDVALSTRYALSEYQKRGLGAWNPGSRDFYQLEIPKRARSKLYVRGSE